MINMIVYEIFILKWLLLIIYGIFLIINKLNLFCCKIRLCKLIKNVEVYEMIFCIIFLWINYGKKKRSIICKKCFILDIDEWRVKLLCMIVGN